MLKSIKKESSRSSPITKTRELLPQHDQNSSSSPNRQESNVLFSEQDSDTAYASRTGDQMTGIAIYARVSSNKQAKDETIASQIHELKHYAKQQGMCIDESDIFADEGFSGSMLIRPALENLRDLVQEGSYQKILIHSPDRLARSYAHQFILLEELANSECKVEFINNPRGDSPEDQLLVQVQGIIAEYERSKIHERTRRGKLHRMRRGEFLSGVRIYGYEYFKKSGDCPAHYKIDLEEAEVIKYIFNTYINEKIPLRKLGLNLEDRGILSAKGGKKWVGTTIRGMLVNPIYTGTGYVNKWKAEEPKYRSPSERNKFRTYNKTVSTPRPRDEWFSFSAPRIIDDDLFNLAQEKLKLNKQTSARRTKKEYLLRGLLKCGICGENIIGQKGHYQCKHALLSRAKSDMVDTCPNKQRTPSVDLDLVVWKEVLKLLKSPTRLKEIYKRLEGKSSLKTRSQLKSLEKKQKELSKQLMKINDLYIMAAITKEEHKNKHSEKKEQLKKIEELINKRKKENVSEEAMLEMLESFSMFSKTIKGSLANADFATKRRGTEELIKFVEVKPDEIIINYAVPLKRKRGTLGTRGV